MRRYTMSMSFGDKDKMRVRVYEPKDSGIQSDLNKAALFFFIAGLILGIGAMTVLIRVLPLQPPPSCFEDEVIVWNGETDEHDICVPIDKWRFTE